MGQGIAQITVFVVVLIALAYPLGLYMARVFADETASAPRPLRFWAGSSAASCALVGDRAAGEQTWKEYGTRCSSSACSSRSSSTGSSACRGTCS